jgi:hypothetical protein
MIKVRALAFLSLVLLMYPAAARQTQMGMDIVGVGLFPSGTYEDVTGPALGILAGVEGEAFPGLGLTLRGGYLGHMERNDYSRVLVPILGGVKITSYSSSFYAAAEAGRVSIRDEYMGNDPLVKNIRGSKTSWSVGLGSAADRLDLRLSLYAWDAAHWRETMTIGLSLGFLVLGY